MMFLQTLNIIILILLSLLYLKCVYLLYSQPASKIIREPIKDDLNMSTITFVWPNRHRRYRLITILLSKFAFSNKYPESKMHPAARLFQPRVKNGLSIIMTLDASDEFPLLAFPHQIASTDVTIPLSRGFVWPPRFSEIWLGAFWRKSIFTMF